MDAAAWLWHPDVAVDEPAFLRFTCAFTATNQPVRFHVSADQHFVLYLDGKRVARGPSRGDVDHWSYATYEIACTPGTHTLEANVWWIGKHAPVSIMSHRGGFALAAEEPYADALTTGKAPWHVARRRGFTFSRQSTEVYCTVGDILHIDAADWHKSGSEWTTPQVIRPAVIENNCGVDIVGGWRSYPCQLPEWHQQTLRSGHIRAVVTPYKPDTVITESHTDDPQITGWQSLLERQTPVTVPAHTRMAVLWDLEDYVCGFYQLRFSGGKKARLACSWSEGLFLPGTRDKAHRSEVIGKFFRGFGDRYTTDGEVREWVPYWVCSGRYVLLDIETDDAPLHIEDWCVQEQRYPLTYTARIDPPQPALRDVIPLCVRALQSCAHDHLMDCPHYEQMMYMGDTRLQLLTLYAVTDDIALPERCLALMDYSRQPFGFVAERYPARERQCSTTFAAISVSILRDFAWWRDRPATVRARLPGMRANLDQFQAYRGEDGLLRNLPGWSFIDWVDTWEQGAGPGDQTGCCALSNLFYLCALQDAVELEQHFGSPWLAKHYLTLARATARAIKSTFWSTHQRAYADDIAHDHFSQHAQCLAIIAGLVPRAQQAPLLRRALRKNHFARATIYFRYYLFEALYRAGMGEALLREYDEWIALTQRGLYTTIEQNEPSRSDCHAWGAHALYHMAASLAGVRPVAPGFREIQLSPATNAWDHIDVSIPHPQGRIELNLKRTPDGWQGTRTCPPDVSFSTRGH